MRFLAILAVPAVLFGCSSSSNPSDPEVDAGDPTADANDPTADAGDPTDDAGQKDAEQPEGGPILVDCETVIAKDGKCSLLEGIENAVKGKQTHLDCAKGGEGVEVVLPAGCTFELGKGQTSEKGSCNTFEIGLSAECSDHSDCAGVCTDKRCRLPGMPDEEGRACIFDSECVASCVWEDNPAVATALPLVTRSIVIKGQGSTLLRKAGSAAVRFFHVAEGATLTLEDVTLSGGHRPTSGGAILVEGSLKLSNSRLSNNSSGTYGGAIAGTSGSCSITVSGTTFEENSAEDGGAIEQDNCVVVIEKSTFSGNTAVNGGALNCNSWEAACTVTSSTFTGNLAGDWYGGGAISFFHGGPKRVAHSTFFDNRSQSRGGALMAYFTSSPEIAFSTISGNECGGGDGGGIYGPFILSTSIVEKNTNSGGGAPNLGGEVRSGGYNHIESTTGSEFVEATGDTIGESAELSALSDNGGPTKTMAPAATSPVVDAIPAGTNGCGTTDELDQRGKPRPGAGDGGCDKGAVEL